MGTLETQLSGIIEIQYKSIRNFALQSGIKVSTLYNILNRGINNANISNIITICNKLGLDCDALCDGYIKQKETQSIDELEQLLLIAFRQLDTSKKMLVIDLCNKLK